MAQLSRPFQIALVAVVLLAGVWLFALQGRSTTTGGAGSSATVSPSAPAAPVVHKPARTTSKASSSHTSSTRAAAGSASHKVSTSATHAPVHRAAKTVPKTATHTPAKAVTQAPAKAVTKAPTKAVTKAPTSTAHKGASAPAAATLTGQHAVEADLAKGDVVVLLFWNPSGTDDVATHKAVQAVKSVRRVAVQEAAANQVASFGSVTRGVQVYATPTIFVIGAHRQAIVLTGVQDAFSIEQTIAEARSS